MKTAVQERTQNVTLSLPKELLQRARLVAVERGISLSGLLREYMSRALRDDERYRESRRRALERLREAAPLGAGERAGWKRDDLHER